MEVVVQGENIDEALRILKRKISQDGIFAKIKDRSESKPSVRRRNKKRKALRRFEKQRMRREKRY